MTHEEIRLRVLELALQAGEGDRYKTHLLLKEFLAFVMEGRVK